MTRPSYYSVHQALTKRWGPARDHLCAGCLGPAAEWAYLHTNKNPSRNRKGSPFSTSLGDYAPLCRSCHRTLDCDSYRENGKERGKMAGAILAERVRNDPEFREATTDRVRPHHRKMQNDPGVKTLYQQTMGRTNRRRYRCVDCGHENNAGNMGWHRKKTGHEQREEVVSDVQ